MITNAFQAMPEGGLVFIEGEEKESQISVSIRDSGGGISSENLDKIFEPLFTTKPRGIGLGLFVCKNMVEVNDGKIEVETIEGEGTSFRVFFPVKGDLMSEKLNILVVDDDKMIAKTLKDILIFKGFQVETAASAGEALNILKEKSFDCMISDVKMPDMNGVELYRNIRKKGIEIPVVFMTAYSSSQLVNEGLEEGALSVIPKPLNIENLASFLFNLHKKGTVMIVDDDPYFTGVLSEILTRGRFEVVEINNAENVIDRINDNIDIVLLDMNLKSTDGLSVYKKIREKYPRIHVVFMTGYREEFGKEIERGLKLGALTCFYKPFPKKELLELMKKTFYKKLADILK